MTATNFVDAVGFNPTTGGTGSFAVSAAITGYQTPAAAGAINGATYSYRAESSDKSQWEIGYGVYTTSGATLARTVTANSLGTTAAVNFTSAPNIYITELTADMQNASLLTSGTLADARTSANIAKLNTAQTFSALQGFSAGWTSSSGGFSSTASGSQITQTTAGITITGGVLQVNAGLSTATGYSVEHLYNYGASTNVLSTNASNYLSFSTDSGPAMQALHRSGAYAINFGLNTNNYVYLGGWSDGSGVYRFAVGPSGDGYFPNFVNVGGLNAFGVAGAVGAVNTPRAWVSFVGSSGGIYHSYNVSSISRTAVGTYTVNYTNAISQADVAGFVSAQFNGVTSVQPNTDLYSAPPSGAGMTIRVCSGGTAIDSPYVTFLLFGQ
jgi:hypothetical protein